MEVKNYFLVTIIILAFALISINLNDLTGAATKTDSATIKVTPSVVKLGEQITISVTPGPKGVKNEVRIYKECSNALTENCEGTAVRIHLCTGSSYNVNCRNPTKTTYTTSVGKGTGIFYAKITEFVTDENDNYREQRASFKVDPVKIEE